ncbi:hypothetical protein BGZ91_006016 [Linnemannia elongata]|nr:hypothetical protein BGZ91_006016 [Linnemannia elongata]
MGPSRSSTSKRVKHSHSASGVADTSFLTGLGSSATNKSSSAPSFSPSAPTVSYRQNVTPAKMTTHSNEAECESLYENYKGEWRTWCASKKYQDGDRATPEKMKAYKDELFDKTDLQIRLDLYSRIISIKRNFSEQDRVLETSKEFYDAFLRKYDESFYVNFGIYALSDTTGPAEATHSAVQASIASESFQNPSSSLSLASAINIHPFASGDSKPVHHQHSAPMDVNNSATDQEEPPSAYHQNWNAWCITGGFDDSNKVTGAKFLAYMKDLIQKTNPSTRTSPNNQGGPSLAILWCHFVAIQELYLDQCKVSGMLSARRRPLALDEFKLLLCRFQARVEELNVNQGTPDAASEQNIVVQKESAENQDGKGPPSLVLATGVVVDQDIKIQVHAGTAPNLKRQDEEEVCQNPSYSPSSPTVAALTGAETLLDQDPRVHDEVATTRMKGNGKGWRQNCVHGQSSNEPTYRDLIPARSATEELSGGSASPFVCSPLAPISQSPKPLNSSNTDADERPRDTEPNIMQELREIKSMLASMSRRPTNELELTRSTQFEQLAAELTAARTSMTAQLTADLESTRKSMTEQLSGEFETARISLSSQFSAGFEATRTTMIRQFSTRLEASLAGFGTKCFAELELRRASLWNEVLAAFEVRHVAMEDQLSAELEAKLETMSKQLVTELKVTWSSISEMISAELVEVPESVSNQVSAGIEEAMTNMSEQLSKGFETALEEMGDTVSEAIASTQASVDGVHLRIGEIERSIRGLWTTMAAERVDPWRALQNANDVHGKRPRRD